MAIKTNSHWIKVVWLTAPQYSLLQTAPIVKTQRKMKSHNNAKTKIDKNRDEITLIRRQSSIKKNLLGIQKMGHQTFLKSPLPSIFCFQRLWALHTRKGAVPLYTLLLLTIKLEYSSPFFLVTLWPTVCHLASSLTKENLQILARWHKIWLKGNWWNVV